MIVVEKEMHLQFSISIVKFFVPRRHRGVVRRDGVEGGVVTVVVFAFALEGGDHHSQFRLGLNCTLNLTRSTI